MTKSLIDALNLPILETDDDDAVEAKIGSFEEALTTADNAMALVEGKDHAVAMDLIHDETLRHARDLMDLGYNVDHARARGIFEQGANFYKIAMESKNSKRDAQLKAMKLALEEKKLELARLGAGADVAPTDVEVVITADRNEILSKLRK